MQTKAIGVTKVKPKQFLAGFTGIQWQLHSVEARVTYQYRPQITKMKRAADVDTVKGANKPSDTDATHLN